MVVVVVVVGGPYNHLFAMPYFAVGLIIMLLWMVFMALSASEHTYHELAAAAAAESESAEAIRQVITTIKEDDRDQK